MVVEELREKNTLRNKYEGNNYVENWALVLFSFGIEDVSNKTDG